MERYEKQVGLQSVDLSTGAVSLAGKLNQFKDMAMKRIEKDAVKRGIEKASQVEIKTDSSGNVIAPEKREVGIWGSIEDEQYNAAITDAYNITLQTDILADVSRIAAENPDDLEAYDKAYAANFAGTINNADPASRQAARNVFTQANARERGNIQTTLIKRKREVAKIERFNSLQSLLESASSIGFGGGDIAPEGVLYKEALDSMVRTGDISADAANTMWKAAEFEIEKSVDMGRINSLFDSDGPEAAKAAFAEMQKGIGEGNYSSGEWQTVLSQTNTMLNRRLSSLAAGSAVQDRQNTDMVNDYILALKEGKKVSEEQTLAVRALAATNERFQEPVTIAESLSETSNLSAEMRAEKMESLMASDGTMPLENVDELTTLEANEAVLHKAFSTEPYNTLTEQGSDIISGEPFNPMDPDSVATRMQDQIAASAHAGFEVPFVSRGEAKAIIGQFPTMTLAQKTALALSLSEATNAFGIFDEEGARSFATVGNTGNEVMIGNVFRGEEAITLGNVKPIEMSDYQDALEVYSQGILEAREIAGVRESAIHAYAGLYGNEPFNRESFEEILQVVGGASANINDFNTLLPDLVTDDQFQDFIDDADVGHPVLEMVREERGVTVKEAQDLLAGARWLKGADGYKLLLEGGGEILREPVNLTEEMITTENLRAGVVHRRVQREAVMHDRSSSPSAAYHPIERF